MKIETSEEKACSHLEAEPSARPDLPAQNGGALRAVLRQARRLIILVVGTTVMLCGIIMLVTPGPGLLVIPIGLAILGLEFAWARRLLRRVREGVQTGMDWRNWEEWKWMVGLRRHRPDRSSNPGQS